MKAGDVQQLRDELRLANERAVILRTLVASLRDMVALESEHGSNAWSRALRTIETTLKLTA